jgi:hypothetical protein
MDKTLKQRDRLAEVALHEAPGANLRNIQYMEENGRQPEQRDGLA